MGSDEDDDEYRSDDDDDGPIIPIGPAITNAKLLMADRETSARLFGSTVPTRRRKRPDNDDDHDDHPQDERQSAADLHCHRLFDRLDQCTERPDHLPDPNHLVIEIALYGWHLTWAQDIWRGMNAVLPKTKDKGTKNSTGDSLFRLDVLPVTAFRRRSKDDDDDDDETDSVPGEELRFLGLVDLTVAQAKGTNNILFSRTPACLRRGPRFPQVAPNFVLPPCFLSLKQIQPIFDESFTPDLVLRIGMYCTDVDPRPETFTVDRLYFCKFDLCGPLDSGTVPILEDDTSLVLSCPEDTHFLLEATASSAVRNHDYVFAIPTQWLHSKLRKHSSLPHLKLLIRSSPPIFLRMSDGKDVVAHSCQLKLQMRTDLRDPYVYRHPQYIYREIEIKAERNPVNDIGTSVAEEVPSSQEKERRLETGAVHVAEFRHERIWTPDPIWNVWPETEPVPSVLAKAPLSEQPVVQDTFIMPSMATYIASIRHIKSSVNVYISKDSFPALIDLGDKQDQNLGYMRYAQLPLGVTEDDDDDDDAEDDEDVSVIGASEPPRHSGRIKLEPTSPKRQPGKRKRPASQKKKAATPNTKKTKVDDEKEEDAAVAENSDDDVDDDDDDF